MKDLETNYQELPLPSGDPETQRELGCLIVQNALDDLNRLTNKELAEQYRIQHAAAQYGLGALPQAEIMRVYNLEGMGIYNNYV